ncbi:permease [Polaribacter vadi]|uniref:permease n=1 Tax=Polaribacter TaxID=52959 RepID=UPI001C087CA6|nr:MULTISPECIES: permease [Polaribacter]MBU3011095.1 permease [Polaribacter vadi]MDO6740909.1 permease [Polaribacter sp. 1_MG-2023]
MDGALEKSISFLLFIFIGVLLKKKISVGNETNGIKSLILTIALPATIFIALLKVKIDGNLILFPVLALGLNIILFAITPILLSLIGIKMNSDKGRSARLLISSLAPGLSCFPFILEFLGDGSLAKAAMADLGNKFFVLFLLYLVALKWHYKNADFEANSLKTKLKSLAKTLLYEPVNLFIIVALILVSFGITLDKIPNFLSSTLTRLSYIMTPLVLLFIGLAVKFKKQQFFQLFSLLLLRAGFTLFLIAGIIFFADITIQKDILVMIAFSLSSASFWPFAHISAVNNKEEKENTPEKTFDTNFALSILALSLPISVILILGILTAGNTFTNINNILLLGGCLSAIGLFYPIIIKVKSNFSISKNDVNTSKKNSVEFLADK